MANEEDGHDLSSLVKGEGHSSADDICAMALFRENKMISSGGENRFER
jgi:hypothetical protein